MADRYGVGRPVLFTLGAAGDEAEIDQRDACSIKLADEVSPDSGMEAPAMDEHEMHLGAYIARARRGARSAARTSSRRSTSVS